MRPIYEIAREIRADWKKPSIYAVPYLDAMDMLTSVNETYWHEPARDVVLRFLCNCSAWRGDVARRIKAELKSL